MESKLGKCPFFRSTFGCVPEVLCARSGLSRTQLQDGSFAKPERCEYPDVTNNDCDVLDMKDTLPPKNILIGERKELIFYEPKK